MMVRLRRYWIQLTADRRKFGTLCTVFGIGLLLWARLIVVSNMPKTAMADPEKNNRTTDETPITDRSSEKRPAPAVIVSLDDLPQRDPFAVSSQFFPRARPDEDSDLEAKKPRQQADDPELAEARRLQQVRALVNELTLDAAMEGASLAVINGRTYRKGDQIDALSDAQVRFTLTDVKQRAVMLEFESRRFELKMSTPGG